MATSPLSSKVLYSDFFTNLDNNPVSEDVAVKTNENAIRQSIRNLLMTNRGERLFQPDLGGNITAMLFENMTPQTIVSAKQQIENVINEHEPRANLIDVVVTPSFDENSLGVQVVFNVINKQEPITLDVILNRVR